VAAFVDYYRVLGVHRQAEPEVIDAAYRALVRRYHPDRNPGDRSAEERTRQIIEAHSILSDAGKRRTFDREWDARPSFGRSPSARPVTRRGRFICSEAYSVGRHRHRLDRVSISEA
jgi:curved DNA-binding protein CbpA